MNKHFDDQCICIDIHVYIYAYIYIYIYIECLFVCKEE